MSMASKFTIRANRKDLDERVVMFLDGSLSYWAYDVGGFIDIQLTWEQVNALYFVIEGFRRDDWKEKANG